jgi:hypothetical protein
MRWNRATCTPSPRHLVHLARIQIKKRPILPVSNLVPILQLSGMNTTATTPPVHDIHSIHQLLQIIDPILSPTSRGLTLSIHIEAGRLPNEAEAARIRFKSEVLERKRELQEHNVPAEEARALLDPADALLHDHEFWNHQLGGLSYFANQDQCMALRCARRFPTVSRFGGDYHLLPLLEAAAMARRFHLLALSENSAFLLRLSDLGFELIPNIPESFATALRSTGFTAERLGEKEFSNHNNRAIEHSHQALRAIDAAVLQALPAPTGPLLLAAVESNANLYREITSYPDLVPTTLFGDPGNRDQAHQLVEQARRIMQPHFRKAEARDALRALKARETDPTKYVSSLPRVVAAATDSNIGRLTLSRSLLLDSTILTEPRKAKLPLHLREDLVDFTARRCLADGGELVFVEPEALPDDTPLLAEARWASVNRV